MTTVLVPSEAGAVVDTVADVVTGAERAEAVPVPAVEGADEVRPNDNC